MSFNNNDNKPLIISLDNYEEYFLMYVDDELTTEEKAAVDAFLLQQPQLREELDILISTKLTDDVLPFEGKESLLAHSMKLNAVDENLLLYIDDELKGNEKKELEKRLHTDAELQFQHNLLLKTKLDRKDIITYPYKKELYRSHKIERPLYWLRIATAVVLVAGLGTFTYFNYNTDNTPAVTAATINKPKDIKKNLTTPAFTIEKSTKQQPDAQLAATNNDRKEQNNIIRSNKHVVVSKEAKKTLRTIMPQEQKNNLAIVENKKGVEPLYQPTEVIASNTKNSQIENNSKTGVTTATTAAYNPVEASDNEIIDALATSENKKGRAIRGFLRKATRFIERTTNIDPVNEDDKLLIGAVALKLK
ncbi:MAG TPA: hypothetical protein VM888_14685 [Chitinophagaceae bacterium]|nr:hypothetical protein [Chitinophagaceae bacterium]